jgi:hypothetical protein
MTSKKERIAPLAQKQNSLPIQIPSNRVLKSSIGFWLVRSKTKNPQFWLSGKIKSFKNHKKIENEAVYFGVLDLDWHAKWWPLYVWLLLILVGVMTDNVKKILKQTDAILEEVRKLKEEAHQGRTKVVSKTTSYTSIIDPEQYVKKKDLKKESDEGKFLSGEKYE